MILRWIIRYNKDELITSHYPDFMENNRFLTIYDRACEQGLEALRDSGFHWKSHVVTWAASYALRLDGDFVECGVNKGFHSKIAIEYMEFGKYPEKKFFLLDTYEGFILDQLSPFELELYNYSTVYEPCYDLVKEVFSPYPNVEIIKGPIPDTLSMVPTSKVAYLSIDMNCVMPEISAAEFFWPKLISGGIIVLDDYGHAGHEDQRLAFNEFAEKKGVQILCLPTGQGVIIK